MGKRKFYVVWVGREPGVYEDWDDCREQVTGFPGARFKAFDSQVAATLAFRGDSADEASIIMSIAGHNAAQAHSSEHLSLGEIPEINPDAIAVDGACAGNPGRMEYRGVDVKSGIELFHVGPLEDGTNNVAEYLALVHALAYLYNKGDSVTPVYSDSRTARSWVKSRGCRTKLTRTSRNGKIFELLARADIWIQTHSTSNPVLRWDTDLWGEIPADFGRK
jgi:ribonuclease HI